MRTLSRGASRGRCPLALSGALCLVALVPSAASQEPAPQPAPSPAQKQAPPPAAPSVPAPSPAVPSPGPEGGRKVFGRIRGTVFDPAKRPMVGLMVMLSAKNDSGLLRVTGTDENGQYLFQDLPAGLYDVHVASPGYASQTKVKVGCQPPFQNIVDFRLVPQSASGTKKTEPVDSQPQAAPAGPMAPGGLTAPVRGRLVDARGKPLVECSVTFVGLGARGIYQAFSGPDGGFSLGALPIGRYHVLIASPGHVTLDLPSIEVSQASGLDLSLSLVDYPLNSKARQEDLIPRERPRPLPTPAPAAPAAPAPEPSPAPAAAPSPAPDAAKPPAAPPAESPTPRDRPGF